MKNLIYFKPDDVDIKDPPIIVKRIKNIEISTLDEYVDIPDVEIDEVTARKILATLSLEIIKK